MLLDLFQAENTKGLMKGRVGCSFFKPVLSKRKKPRRFSSNGAAYPAEGTQGMLPSNLTLNLHQLSKRRFSTRYDPNYWCSLQTEMCCPSRQQPADDGWAKLAPSPLLNAHSALCSVSVRGKPLCKC